MLFGQSSEKDRNKLENKILQAEKRLAELEARLKAAKDCLEDTSVPADTAPAVDSPSSGERTSSRNPLPATLPRETRCIAPAETVCPACSGELGFGEQRNHNNG